MNQAMDAVGASAPDSAPESAAMSAAIAAARHEGAPTTPKDAFDHAIVARRLAAAAKSPADFTGAAQEQDLAARAAPWIADFQFAHGEFLTKAQAYGAAARAFSLYLEAAPQAKDAANVRKLIAALQRRAPDQAGNDLALASLHRPGEQYRACRNCPEMVILPAGRFTMGSPDSEKGRFDSEGPRHDVVMKSFALGKYEVTEEEFTAFLADTGYQPGPCNRIMDKMWRSPGGGIVYPPGMADLPRQPAVCVSWQDTQAYIKWLNGKLSAEPSPRVQAPFRLPSEAEWEYAARAGSTTSRWWGEAIGAGNANCHGCGSAWDNTLIAPVGSFGPNAFGLYDMLGNVWQWLADCWNESYAGAPTDGSAWATGDCSKRVMRGGSWSNLPVFIRSAARSRGNVNGADFDYSSYVAFRLAQSLP